MITIRHADPSDLKELSELRALLAQEEARINGEVLTQAGWLGVYADLYNSLSVGSDTWILACDGEEVVGYARVVWSRLIGSLDACHVAGVYVKEPYRRGRALLALYREVFRCAGERGTDTIQGYVHIDRPEVIDMWMKRGAKEKAIILEVQHGRQSPGKPGEQESRGCAQSRRPDLRSPGERSAVQP